MEGFIVYCPASNVGTERESMVAGPVAATVSEWLPSDPATLSGALHGPIPPVNESAILLEMLATMGLDTVVGVDALQGLVSIYLYVVCRLDVMLVAKMDFTRLVLYLHCFHTPSDVLLKM
jgi:hypothetical protein